MGRLDGKVAMVTGAGRGIGLAIAKRFAAENARVVITDRDVTTGRAAAEQIVSDGGEAVFVEHDVTDEQQWIAVIRHAVEVFGALNILVNNAGICMAANLEETTLEQWRALMAVNMEGTFLGTKQAIIAMKSGRGSIVNMSSTAAIVGDPSLAAYDATKGGVRIFTKAAALHCAKYGYDIRVNSVHPAYIWTPMVEDFLEAAGDVAAGRAAADALHPIGRMGEAIDVANAVLYLASDEAKFSTGSELVVDGGYTAQ